MLRGVTMERAVESPSRPISVYFLVKTPPVLGLDREVAVVALPLGVRGEVAPTLCPISGSLGTCELEGAGAVFGLELLSTSEVCAVGSFCIPVRGVFIALLIPAELRAVVGGLGVVDTSGLAM
mmetsp:Transcript_4714/g.10827  ORF Transcript_4714/g.10827 Transcript_4714/m.10827 type:complete len:123 (-) Transcript_4714:120-488(-)